MRNVSLLPVEAVKPRSRSVLGRAAHVAPVAGLACASMTSAVIAFAPSNAYAWYDICNNTGKEIVVAFAYPDTMDARDIKPDYDSHTQSIVPRTHTNYVAEGWYRQKPGQCSRVFPHELWRRGYNYFWYAKAVDGSLYWGVDQKYSKQRFCISESRFTSRQRIDGTCEPGTFPQGFKRTSIPYKGQNYTLRISP